MASTNHAASRVQPISPAIDPAFEHYLRDIPGLTYASSEQSWIYRTITNTVRCYWGDGLLNVTILHLSIKR